MVGKTERFVLNSGNAVLASGLVDAFSIDGTGCLRNLKLFNDAVSGTVTVKVVADGDVALDCGRCSLGSGGSVIVNLAASCMQGSGAVLISGDSTVDGKVCFVESLVVQYGKGTSGTVSMIGIVDVNKRLIQT